MPKNTRALAVRRTPLAVVRTTGSRTVTPLTVCGNDGRGGRVSWASVTVRLNARRRRAVAVALARGVGDADRVGAALL